MRPLLPSAVLLIALVGCSNIFGPDTPTGHSVRSGIVTSAVDGSPIEGAELYPLYYGWVVGGGIVIETAVTDAAGRYRLDTEHYCGSQLGARAEGYGAVDSNLSYLGCPDTGPLVVDIVLSPSAWGWADYAPAWSPNGFEIAISSNRPDLRGDNIHLIDLLGNAVQLTNGVGGGSPSWSPDGLRIAFTGSDVGIIYVVGRDGLGLTEFQTSLQIAGVAWSPDGETIAFWTIGGSVESHIYLFDIATSAVTRLTQPGSSNVNLSWSPDGSQAVFQSHRSGLYQIYRVEADGSDVTRLSDIPGIASDPAWSPCGTRIAFTSWAGAETIIQMMDSDGSNVAILTDEGIAPSWSPDCSKIAFSSNRDVAVQSARDIWIINADGSGLRKLTRRE